MFAVLIRLIDERTFVTTESGNRVCFLGLFTAYVVPDVDTERQIVVRSIVNLCISCIITIAAGFIAVRFRLALATPVLTFLLCHLVQHASLGRVTERCIALPRRLSMRLYASLVEPKILNERIRAMVCVIAIVGLGCVFEPNQVSNWIGLVVGLVLASRETYAFFLSRSLPTESIAES